MVSCLHELVQIALHVLHTDMELLAVGIEKDVERWNEVAVGGQGSEKNHFAELKTRGERLECLLHRLNSNLE